MDYSKLSIVRPPQVNSVWLTEDYMGALRVRFSIGRNQYRVKPGLYRLGSPGRESEVIVTANYKLSFDTVRRSLNGLSTWILVLETFGINVWCAAGKGTFGTAEMVRQVKNCSLDQHVSHRRLIVPQLGASGVSAKLVKEATGFGVKFGPVRADDIKAYISSGYRKSEMARTVQFRFKDRLVLTAAELANSLRYLLLTLVFFALLSGIHTEGYSIGLIWKEGWKAWIYLLAAYFSGAFLAPLLLPALPFRHFGGKGLVSGILLFGLIVILSIVEMPAAELCGWFLISGAISSYLTMNFTGASTYTSLSGVKKEMSFFVPIQLILALAGLTLLVISKLV